MDNVLQELEVLQFDSLSEDWINLVYNSEFLEIDDIPEDYSFVLKSVNVTQVYRKVIISIDFWQESDFLSSEAKNWAVLSSLLNYRGLVSLIAYHLDRGHKNVMEHGKVAIVAAQLYYKLVLIPGCKAYNIYHSQILLSSLMCLAFPRIIGETDDVFSIAERNRDIGVVIKMLLSYVEELNKVLKELQLQLDDIIFEDVLSHLIEFIGVSGKISNSNKLNVNSKLEYSQIKWAMYQLIETMLRDSRGQVTSAAIIVLFKCMLPKLVVASVDNRSANNQIQAAYVTCSGLLLKRYGKCAVDGFYILLQQLCYNQDGLERAEVRLARVMLVMALMNLLSNKSYRAFVNWLLTLSAGAKIAHRQIALEILGKLFNNEPEEESDQSGDSSPNPNESVEDNEIGSSSNTSIDGDSLALSDQGINLEAEEDVCSAAARRTHRTRHGAVLEAVCARVRDVSSTVRGRALALLADLLLNPSLRVLKDPTICSQLVNTAAQSLNDERAVVRRAAVLLLHRLMLNDREHIHSTKLQLLVSVCRDASVLVRGAAVGALGELSARWAAPAELHAFLAGPLHQLADPEAKIQEQVIGLVHQIGLKGFDVYSPNETPSQQLPWNFVAAITTHNMRRHLQKAYALMKNKDKNIITPRLVNILRTHLGVSHPQDRSLHCLVMLTCICKQIDYSDVDFLLDFYYKLAQDTENSDCRLILLTIELLTEWSQWIQGEKRASLHAHLIKGLGDGTWGAEGCRGVCAVLAAHLEPTNLAWADNLMNTYASRSLAGGPLQEWLSAADLSLVAPSPPPAALPQLFADALTAGGDARRRGELVCGLGRLCIRSRTTAVAAGPILAKVLASQDEPIAPRVNALLALADICTRYSNIVEPQLDTMSACVERSAPAPLRRAAARSLSRLLLAGYLRLRRPLYYRYCALLADEDSDVREPAEYYVTSCLPPDDIYHQFVDCVMHYNGCGPHAEVAERINSEDRQLVYDVMLQRLSLVQRLNVQCRLASDILQNAASICDQGEELTEGFSAALVDAITLLCGPRMKLPNKPNGSGDPNDISDLTERVTTNIVSHKMKSTVAEVLVPAVLRLYAHMRARTSPLADSLVRIATDLLLDYRLEIEKLIENDEELMERIKEFQQSTGIEPTLGNFRNLVTTSNVPEPETPASSQQRRPRLTPYTPSRRSGARGVRRALRVSLGLDQGS